MPMKKISTPSLKRQEAAMSTSEPQGPSQSTLAFIRNFARACKSLPLCDSDSRLASVIVN